MEGQLFNWTDWDGCMYDSIYQFYNVVTKVSIANYPPGTEFDCAVVDYENGILQFLTGSGELISEHELILVVVN